MKLVFFCLIYIFILTNCTYLDQLIAPRREPVPCGFKDTKSQTLLSKDKKETYVLDTHKKTGEKAVITARTPPSENLITTCKNG